jgi:Ricin-type beta-trefoil lectin domain-like
MAIGDSSTPTETWTHTKKFWALAQFSKFIRPGAFILDTKPIQSPNSNGRHDPNVQMVVAYRLQEKQLVIVASNNHATLCRTITLNVTKLDLNDISHIHMYRTSEQEELLELSTKEVYACMQVLSADGPSGILQCTLAPESITTILISCRLTLPTTIPVANNLVHQSKQLTRGPYKIISAFNKKCLTCNGRRDPQVFQETYQGKNSQHWILYPVIDEDTNAIIPDTFTIMNVRSTRLLDVNRCDVSNGNNIITWPRSGKWNQEWYIKPLESQPDKFMVCVATRRSKCLDVGGWDLGGNLLIWDVNDGDNQHWQFVKIL